MSDDSVDARRRLIDALRLIPRAVGRSTAPADSAALLPLAPFYFVAVTPRYRATSSIEIVASDLISFRISASSRSRTRPAQVAHRLPV